MFGSQFWFKAISMFCLLPLYHLNFYSGEPISLFVPQKYEKEVSPLEEKIAPKHILFSICSDFHLAGLLSLFKYVQKEKVKMHPFGRKTKTW